MPFYKEFTGTPLELDQALQRKLDDSSIAAEHRNFTEDRNLRGALNEELYATYFWLGNPQAPTRIVITTGLHGAEREIGTLFILDLLRLKRRYEEQLGRECAILVIDNLSPWATSYNTRFTQHGFDPNRTNGPKPAETNQLPKRYQDIDELINIPKLTTGAALKTILGLWWYKYVHPQGGQANFERIIAEGQSHDPERMLYVASGECWPNTTLRQILKTELQGCKHVIHIDIHTALGWWSECLKVVIDHPSSDRFTRAVQLFGARRLLSTKVPNGYTQSDRGTIEQIFYDVLEPEQLYTGVCAEVGTWPINFVVPAMWLRDRVVRTRETNPEFFKRNDAWSRKVVKLAFAPQNKLWRHLAIANLHNLTQRTIRVARVGIY